MRNQPTDNWVFDIGIRPIVYSHTSRGLTNNDNLRSTSAKALDIVTDPLNGQPLIKQADVRRQSRGAREAEYVQSQRLNSEEDILPSQHEQPDSITRKMDFTIAYHRNSEESLSSLQDDHSTEAHV
jgi:hypothetical protein